MHKIVRLEAMIHLKQGPASIITDGALFYLYSCPLIILPLANVQSLMMSTRLERVFKLEELLEAGI
ncbi:hypothetical protein D3C78_1908530 [compost metagenome]